MLGGAVALTAIGCGPAEAAGGDCPAPVTCPEPTTCPAPTTCPEPTTCPPPAPEDMKTAEFPYRKYVPANFQFDIALAMEDAYHGYYEGACCHGVYSAFLKQLQPLGSPFTKLPRDLMKFGKTGLAGYGSICGALLGGAMIENMIVADVSGAPSSARDGIMTELLRWYERELFPQYVPAKTNSKEKNLTLDWSVPSRLGNVPGTHLCHGSVSKWCMANSVSTGSMDKKARCSRLTADVAKKVGLLLNDYFKNTAMVISPLDPTSATCVSCHTPGEATNPSSATGMSCTSCHDPHPT